jgi:XTP/dITP diphosphohydrolase
MIPSRVVLATANPGKIAELGPLVAGWGVVDVMSLDAFPGVRLPEEGDESYAANAVAKARAVAAATALPALGDDSGLEVDALGGAPGVRSARWAPTDGERVAKLLDALGDAAGAGRRARFRCAAALVWPDGRAITAEGECAGRIAGAPSGRGGFGYDPVFVPDGLDTTFAAAPPEVKRRLSHRARAIVALGASLARA